MPDPSTIQIMLNGDQDITRYVVFSRTRFEAFASAMPGTATVVLKDSLRELTFVTGDEITLLLDGVLVWGGLVMQVSEGHFFPVVDTSDMSQVFDLMWLLECADFNIWMDKRVIRDPTNYLDANGLKVGPGKLGAVLRDAIPRFMDVPPGLDYTSQVDDTSFVWQAQDVKDEDGNYITRLGDPAPLRQQGTKWREQLDEATRLGGFTWRIDAHKRLHLHEIETLEAPWGFTDHDPDGVTAIGFREGRVREDGSQMVTDALVWGGTLLSIPNADGTFSGNDKVVFARYPDPPANTAVAHGITMPLEAEERAIQRITDYGRWQRAEVRFNDPIYFDENAVKLRAYSIVAGPDTGLEPIRGLDMGLNRPVWQVSLAWFAHDVPAGQHLEPGALVAMNFYTFGSDLEHPLPLFLPLRSVSITFPTLPPKLPDEEPLTYARFDGQFGISYSDSRYLWQVLINRQQATRALAAATTATVDNGSGGTVNGALGAFFPLEAADGSRIEFTLPFSYQAGTTEVYLNGLLQRPRYEYVESNPRTGQITFAVAPFPDDTIWVICRTGAS